MPKEIQSINNDGRNYQKPSERTARFILGILGWIKDIFNPTRTVLPRGQVFQHQGCNLAAGKVLRYSRILLVEDEPNIAQGFINAINNYYVFGPVKIHVAYAYDAALRFFDNEDINLVIMDADLDDLDGDGATLTRIFLAKSPGVTILANSSSRISNLQLTGLGALETLGKSTEKLTSWLMLNDPAGSGG